MSKQEKQELLDKFAIAAMQALITKSPFFDEKSQYGKGISQEELTVIKKGLVATAYEYAAHALTARENSKKWLEENDNFFS